MERVVSDRLSYNEGGILGKGTAGFVFSGTLDGQMPVAVKRVQLMMVDSGLMSQRKAEAQKREEEAVRQLDHPNVVKILHLDQDSSFRYFAIELCLASLDQCFLKDNDPKKYKGILPTEPSVCYQLANGLQYIHSRSLLHRGIKPENVLISQSASMKLSDFGLPKPIPRGASSTALTQYWMAPEVLKVEDKRDLDKSSVHSDTFSLGLVMFCYFTNGLHLFGSMKNLISVNILSGKAINLNKLSQDHFAHDIVVSMTKSLPEQRAKLSDVIGKLKPLLPTTDL